MDDDGCPICFDELESSGTSQPDTCNHIFHTNCIKRWALKKNSCPSCRAGFNRIISTYKDPQGNVATRSEEIEDPVEYENIDDDPDYICHICYIVRPGDDESTLICEGCELGFHMECLNPPLTEVPEGDWFCPACSQVREFDEGLMDICNNCFIRNENDRETILICEDCNRGFHIQCVNRPRDTQNWYCVSCSVFHDEDGLANRALIPRRRIVVEESESSDDERNDVDSLIDFLDRDAAVLLESDDFAGIDLPAVRRRLGRMRGRGRGRARPARGRRQRRGSNRRVARRTGGGRGQRRARRAQDQQEENPVSRRQVLPRLGITSFSDEVGDLDSDPTPSERQSSLPSSSQPLANPSSNPSQDLLGNILEEQQKALAPGALFMQKNGKFIPREKEYNTYLSDVSAKEMTSKEKAWPGLTTSRSSFVKNFTSREDSLEGRSDGRPPVSAWPLRPTREEEPKVDHSNGASRSRSSHVSLKRSNGSDAPTSSSHSGQRERGRHSSNEPEHKIQRLNNNNGNHNDNSVEEQHVEALTIPTIDKLCKGTFDRAFKKRRISREQYKMGMKYVVKTAFSKKWQEEKIKDECRKFIHLSPKPENL